MPCSLHVIPPKTAASTRNLLAVPTLRFYGKHNNVSPIKYGDLFITATIYTNGIFNGTCLLESSRPTAVSNKCSLASYPFTPNWHFSSLSPMKNILVDRLILGSWKIFKYLVVDSANYELLKIFLVIVFII